MKGEDRLLATLNAASSHVPATIRGVPISQRERHVLACLIAGQTTDEAAVTLMIDAETVKSHVKRLIGKLGAGNRTRVVAIVLAQIMRDNGLLIPRVSL
jgi:DNA-binding CsgD family transcriptional regulator